MLLVGVLPVASICSGQSINGLKLDFKKRIESFDIAIDDLEEAYLVDPDGAIRMLAHPAVTEVSNQRVEIEVAPSKSKTGVFRLSDKGAAPEIRVNRDNSLAGDTRIGGLPFGYAFLPPGGKAVPGQSWEESFPAPAGDGGVKVEATFRYTLVGPASSDGCPDCVEIKIVGLRRFVADRSLAESLAGVFSDSDDSFYTANQVFAVGSVLFSPGDGMFQRFELGMNTSVLTPLAVPGMMRRVVVEREGVSR